ncbi:MAG: serine/threonine-protein kinase [Verrucomicrobiota bacterium]
MRCRLGEGGMGSVWEAFDSRLKRTVALKVIRGFAFSTASERQRFTLEATAVAQLDHPNIVPVYDVGEVDGQPYFTMKLLEGRSLSERMAEGPLEEREAVRTMEKVARAIHHAHERAVLHRDLKPGNVLFDDQGEPFLSDFGLAKWLDSDAEVTRTNAVVGTPHYMSPEQARGLSSEITEASDVWGAGALFFHMLTGLLPFPGGSSGEILDRVVRQDPLPMGRSSVSIDPQLETLCLRCMEKNPGDRLDSAEALAEELKRWLEGQPIRIKGAGPAGAVVRWLRCHPGRFVAALVVSCLLVVAGILAVVSQTGEPPDEAQLANRVTDIPLKFRMEAFSIDGDRRGPRFFVGWTGSSPGIIPHYMDQHPDFGSYIFHLEREDVGGGVAIRVLNFHLPEEDRKYYLPNLTSNPVVYRVTDPLWGLPEEPSEETNLRFFSLQYEDRYLRHSGRMLFNHVLHPGEDDKEKRIFQQDSTWTGHQIR